MGLNFLGLGFSLGAQDKGLGDAIKSTSAGLMNISKTVVDIGLASAKMIFKAPNFGPAMGLAQTLANDVKLTTTGMEAYGVAASKATKAAFAGLGLDAKKAQEMAGQASSIAFDMNTDVNAVAKSMAAQSQAGIKVAELGFDTQEEFQKVMSVTGTDATALAATLGTMQHSMGMTPKAIKETVQGVVALGTKMGVGKEALAGMIPTIGLLKEQFQKMPSAWPPKRMQEFVKGTTAVAGALTSLGAPADQAFASANKIGEVLLQGQTGMKKLYSGLADKIPDGMKVLTENLGDMDDAFKMLNESPDQFMLKMGNLVKQVKHTPGVTDASLTRIKEQMSDTFGPAVLQAFTDEGLDKLGPALKDAQKPIPGAEKAMHQMAAAYEDGRTYAERFAIAQDIVQTKLKKVHGVMSDSKYLTTYIAQGKEFTNWADKTASKGGALGKLTSALVEVTNRGFGGFLASHSKFGFAMSEGIKLMQPMLQYLPAMKMAFSALASPIGLVVGALAGLYFLFKDLNKGKDSIIAPMLKKFMAAAPVLIHKVFEFAKDVFKTIFDVLSKVDWDSVMNTVSDAFKTIFSTVFDVLASINWGKVIDAVSAVFEKVFSTVFDVLASINWGAVADTMSAIFTKIFDTIFAVIEKIDWNKVGQLLGTMFGKAMEVAATILRGAVKLIARIFQWLGDVDWGSVGSKLMGYILPVIDVVIDAIGALFTHLPAMVVKAVNGAVDFLLGALTRIEDYLVKKFPDAAKPIIFIVEMLKAAVKIVGEGLKLAFKAVWAVLGAVWDIIKTVVGAIVDVVVAVKDAVVWIGDAVGKVGSFFSSVGSGIRDFFTGSSSEAQVSINDTMKLVQDSINKTVQIANEAAKKAKDERDADLRAHGVATEGYVKTVEGQILKSTEAFVRFENDATGAVIKVAHATADYTRAIVGGEVAKSMDDMQAEIRRLNDVAKQYKSGTDEWHKAMDESIAHADQVHDDYFKKFGARWDIMYQRNEQMKDQYQLENKTLEQAKQAGVGYYDAMIANQQKLSEGAMNDILHLEQLRQKGEITADEFEKRNAKINARVAGDVIRMKESADIVSGDLATIFKQYSKNAEDTADFAMRASFQMAKVFEANGKIIMDKIPEGATATRDAVKSAFDDLSKAQSVEIEKIINNGKLTADEMQKQVRGVQDKYKGMQNDYAQAVEHYSKELAEGNTAGLDKMIADNKAKLDGATKELKVKAQEGAGEIQKMYGTTNAETLDSIHQIGALKPAVFTKNMEAVQGTFLKFLGVMDDKGKKIMENTTKSFNTMWKTMNDGWKANEDLVVKFTDSAAAHVDAYWSKVMMAANNAVVGFIGLTKQIELGLSAMARTLNIMDLLASPDQITKWAASVVSALAYAFRTGDAADSMISASYNKALAMAAEIQANAGTATPDTASMKTSPSSSAITAAQGLLTAINRPAWANDPTAPIPATLESINQNLIAALAQMNAAAQGKAVTAAKAAKPNVTRAGK